MGPKKSMEQDSADRPDGPRADAAADATLAALYAEPCTIARPLRQRVPFIFASPHSGRLYPPSFVARSRLGAMALRRSEDAFVDDLIAMAAVELGAPVIAARFPRAFLDVNRAPGELDTQMFDGALALARRRAERARAGGAGRDPTHRARRRRHLSREAQRGRSRRTPFEALPALSRGPSGPGRRDARGFRRGRGDRLPFHAVGGGRARHRARRPLRHRRRAAP